MRGNQIEDFTELLDKRHELISEAARLLGDEMSSSDEKRVVELLRSAGGLRRKFMQAVSAIDISAANSYEREYYRTLLDYITLVDGDREEEVLLKAISIARKKQGFLQDNINWLLRELEEVRKYRGYGENIFSD